MSNKIQVRRGTAAGRPTFDSGEPGLDTDAVRAWIGTTEGNRELQLKGSTTDYTIYVATSAFGGVPSSSGATGKPLLTGTADAGTGGTTLYDAAGTFTSAAHLNKAIYNATTGVWSKVASVSSSTNLTLSVSGSFAAGDTYVITNAFDNIPEAFNVADAGYNANITIRVSDGAFSNVLTLIGKTAGAAKTLTLQGSTTATTTVSGETSIYQKINLKNITFTKRIFEYFGADVDWTTCVTSGDDGFLLLKSTSVANVFRTSSVIIFENDPAVYTSISSTVTKGYTIYVATSTYGGDDAVGDGLKITQGTATSTSASKLVDSTANFNSTDHLNKTLYNSTDDTWAKITAIDSTTQVSISADIMASGEAYVISNAFATVQKAVDAIPGSVNSDTTLKLSNEIFREDVDIWGKNFTGAFNIYVKGTRSILSSGTATSGANPVGNGSAGYGTLTDTGKAWTVNAYQNKFVEITGGTGSGQIRVIHSNTATVLTITGRWDTVPDATSTYKVLQIDTRVTGANSGAETTPVRDYVFKLDNGQKGVIFQHIKTDYAGNANYEGCLLIFKGSSCEAQYCHFEGGNYWNVHVNGSSAFKSKFNVYRLAAIGDIRCDMGSVTTMVRGCRLTGSANRSLDASVGGSIFSIYESYVGQVTAWNGIIATQNGCIDIDAYLDVDGSTLNNLYASSGGILFINALYGAQSTIVSKNAGAWGFKAETGGHGDNVSGITYSGNTSGTYTPTTTLAGSAN